MNPEYKALICDVDGTLVRNQRDARPSPKVKEAIHQARGKVHVGLATARPYKFVEHIIKEIELTCPCILGNGVQIYDPVTDKILVEHGLPEAHLADVYDILCKLGVECIVQERENRVAFSSTYLPQNPLYIYVPTFDESLTEAFMESMSNIPDIIVHKMVSWEKGKSDYLITNHKATKQQAILEVAQLLGIEPKEMIAVGDGYNDFPLLMACGWKVAMGNAVDDLKAIADYVAPTVEEDGVADVIRKFILNTVA